MNKHDWPCSVCGSVLRNGEVGPVAGRCCGCDAIVVADPDERRFVPVEGFAAVTLPCDMPLTKEQVSILDHTVHRTATGVYCGGGPDMDVLVARGLMEFAGRKSFVPDGYYRITSRGREYLKTANN